MSEALAFDMYGTLVDPISVRNRLADYALAASGQTIEEAQRRVLLAEYQRLEPYPDTVPGLRRLAATKERHPRARDVLVGRAPLLRGPRMVVVRDTQGGESVLLRQPCFAPAAGPAGTLHKLGSSQFSHRCPSAGRVDGFGFSHVGAFYVLLAPILGWIAVALSGSNTASNAVFGQFQLQVARLLGAPPLVFPVLNSVGAEVGKPVAPQTASVGVSTTQYVRNESDVIKHNMPWTLIVLVYLIAIGCIFYFVMPSTMT